MKNKLNLLVILFLIIPISFLTSAYGLQVIKLDNNSSTSVNISALELTRIFVDNDRIQNIRGVTGAYTVKNDNVAGDIYIKPTYEYQQRAFNIFVTTEEGRTFSLMLIPKNVPSDNIMIRLSGVVIRKAAKWETVSSYENTVTNLITAMINNAAPDGYSVTQIIKIKKRYLGNIATLQLKTIYNGIHLRGEVYVVTNISKKPIEITETEFYRVGTRAVSIQNSTIPVSHSTILYMVMSNE